MGVEHRSSSAAHQGREFVLSRSGLNKLNQFNFERETNVQQMTQRILFHNLFYLDIITSTRTDRNKKVVIKLVVIVSSYTLGKY